MIPTEIKPVIDYSVRDLCIKPYHNHKKGCPNWNKKKGCPPTAEKIEDVIDLTQTVFCIYNKFNLGKHTNKMEEKHPKWSEYQLRCCLYWQGKARKELKEKIELFRQYFDSKYIVLTCPEAHGVNVTATMKQLGINLEWPPVRYSYQIALAGCPKRT